MMYPLVRELAGDGIPVTVTCRVLRIARQPYYRWLKAPVSDRELDDAYLANAVFDAHRDDPEFGYRFLADEVRQAGYTACDRTVWRHCAANGWWSRFGKPKPYRGAKAGPPVHDDLVRREFSADAPNRLWVTDIERHEALLNRAVVKGHRLPVRRSGRVEAEGSLNPGTRGRVASSPDKAGTGQHRQMVRVRQARRKGVT